MYRIYSYKCPGHQFYFWILGWVLIGGWALVKFSPFFSKFIFHQQKQEHCSNQDLSKTVLFLFVVK